MYLSAYQTNLLGRVMTTLAEPHEERDIRSRVGELMLDLLGAQHYASYVWDDHQRCFDRGVQLNMDPANLQRYEQHYQYHDPITFKLQAHRAAVRVTDVMAQHALKRTEFFNDFLARDGLYWGVNLYAWEGGRNIGDMRIWRDKRRENFSRDDLQLLDLVSPALTAALCRSRQSAPAPRVIVSEPTLGLQALLSAREREVARLAADGLSDKDLARQLGISITTVRTHLDHAFRKLKVNNRMALVQKLHL
jgi:DNA-binding CsgD family transcriptional regulator